MHDWRRLVQANCHRQRHQAVDPGGAAPPAHTLAAVAALANPDWLFEIDAVAAKA